MRPLRQTGAMPSSSAIVDETFARLGFVAGSISQEEILERFNELLNIVWVETLKTLEAHEDRVYKAGIPAALMEENPEELSTPERVNSRDGFREATIELFGRWYPALRQVFLSISQSRMTRGGKDFELQIEGLLRLAGVPFDKQERQDRTDLILPSVAVFQQNVNIAAVVSVKRTLRERWAEVAEELFNLRSPNVFLFTPGGGVSRGHIDRICGSSKIHLLGWDG